VYCCAGGVPLWCWYVRRASGFRGVIGMSLIERKDYGKTRMRGRKKNFKCYTYMCMYTHIRIAFKRYEGLKLYNIFNLQKRHCE